jgi:hypothetical protein
MVPIFVVKVIAQIVPREGSQIAVSIGENLRLGNIVFLAEAVEKRRSGVCPAAAVHVYFEQEFRFRVDRGVELFLFAVYLDLFLIDRDPRRRCRRRVAL